MEKSLVGLGAFSLPSVGEGEHVFAFSYAFVFRYRRILEPAMEKARMQASVKNCEARVSSW
jgi:hypothetical protein